MRRWCHVVLTVMAASVSAAACAASDTDTTGTDESASGDTAGLLVTIEDPAETELLLVDTSGRTVGAVDLSSACRSACGPRRVFAAAGGAPWYVSTDEGVVAVDRVSASAELVAPGSNVLVDPDSRRHLVVDGRAGQITVIDTETGAEQTIDAFDSPVVRVFDAGAAVVVTSARAETMIVDPGRARVTRLGADVVVGLQPVDPSGTRVLAVAGRQRDRQLIAIRVDEPDTHVVIGSAPSTSFVTGWLGDDVIVVEPTEGTISVVDQGRSDELPPITPSQSGSARLHPDPTSTHALLHFDDGPDSRWYQLAAEERSVLHLADLDGLSASYLHGGPDVVIVDDHDDESLARRVLAARIGSGEVTELASSPDPRAYATAPAGADQLYLRQLSGGDEAWLIDLATSTRVPAVVGSNPLVSPGGSLLAVTIRDGRDVRTVNIPIDGGRQGPTVDGWAIGWIPT